LRLIKFYPVDLRNR